MLVRLFEFDKLNNKSKFHLKKEKIIVNHAERSKVVVYVPLCIKVLGKLVIIKTLLMIEHQNGNSVNTFTHILHWSHARDQAHTCAPLEACKRWRLIHVKKDLGNKLG